MSTTEPQAESTSASTAADDTAAAAAAAAAPAADINTGSFQLYQFTSLQTSTAI